MRLKFGEMAVVLRYTFAYKKKVSGVLVMVCLLLVYLTYVIQIGIFSILRIFLLCYIRS